MRWNIGDNRNLFLKLKSKLRLNYGVLKTPKTSKKLTLTVVQMQQLPDIEEISCPKCTVYNGRKVCVNFQTDTDKLNVVVYRNRNSLYLKDNKNDLKLTGYQSLLAKQVHLLSYIDIVFKRCIVLDETTVHKQNKRRMHWMLSF